MHKAQYQIKELDQPPFFKKGLEFSPPTRGTWTIAHTPMLIPECMEIFVCPQGCLRGVVLSAAEFGGLSRFAMVTIEEQDLYKGDFESLFIDGIKDILNHLDILPPCVMVYTSCIHHFAALDLNMVMKILCESYPSIDFIENYMNCTMRTSQMHFENKTMVQLYAPLKKVHKQRKTVNVIGNTFALDLDCEIYQMFRQNAWMVRDICLCESYQEYQEMAYSSYNIVTMPVALESGKELEKRLNQPLFYMPISWDYQEIKDQMNTLAQQCSLSFDCSAYEKEANKALALALRECKDIPIQIDYSATPRPLGLAKLLIEHGFHVSVVYTDTLLAHEQEAFDWLKVHCPNLLIRATIDFRCRKMGRDEGKKEKILAIGQKAAYYAGTPYFVNMVYNDGLYGFVGIRKLAMKIREALWYPKDTEQILSVKAKGCIG